MSDWRWNLQLSGLGLLTLYLAGRKTQWAWIVGLIDEALWAAYAVATRQWAFCASAVVYAGLYLRNLYRWHAETRHVGRGRRIVTAAVAFLTTSVAVLAASLACSACHSARNPYLPREFQAGQKINTAGPQ